MAHVTTPHNSPYGRNRSDRRYTNTPHSKTSIASNSGLKGAFPTQNSYARCGPLFHRHSHCPSDYNVRLSLND